MDKLVSETLYALLLGAVFALFSAFIKKKCREYIKNIKRSESA